MKQSYQDIRDRLGDPKWWDEAGCPRYSDFNPDDANNIYANEAVLMIVACQDCGCEFKVCLTDDRLLKGTTTTLAERIKTNRIHYGDPPNSGCCMAGPTMNSVPKLVLEYWSCNAYKEWKRDPSLEVSVKASWE